MADRNFVIDRLKFLRMIKVVCWGLFALLFYSYIHFYDSGTTTYEMFMIALLFGWFFFFGWVFIFVSFLNLIEECRPRIFSASTELWPDLHFDEWLNSEDFLKHQN